MVVGYMATSNNKTKKVIFLTRHGVYRCFYISRSPLAKLFRKFIGNLLDHMITYETELLQKISKIFKTDNYELIEHGISDLNSRLIEYEIKYKEECQRSNILEVQIDDEYKKRKELELENTENDILNSYNLMHIEQLKKEKKDYANRIRTIQNIVSIDSEPELVELKMLKEKYMKPIYIYILHPNYFSKLLNTKLKLLQPKPELHKNLTIQTTKQLNDIQLFENNINSTFSNINSDINSDIKKLDPNDTDITLDIIEELIQEMPIYKRNFDHIYADINESQFKIDPDEILYFHICASKKIEKLNKPEKLIYIDTQWISNKKHLLNTFKTLSENCNNIVLNKLILYKTSIDEIKDSIRETFDTN